MISFLARRAAAAIVLLVAISFVAFTLLYASGGDIARNLLGELASQETVDRKAAELGLNEPLLLRYFDWVTSAVVGDFGRSWFSGELVVVSVTNRLFVTLTLVIGATLLAAVLSVILGVTAARKRGAVDGAVQVLSLIGFAIPSFLVALGLVLLFSIQLGWFRATGFIPITTSVQGWLSSITLPIVALSLGAVAAVSQQLRGAVLDISSRDFVRTERARGLGSRRVLFRHILRNAAGPGLAVLAVQFIGLLGGAVIVEQVFALPGIGQLAVTATSQGDIPMVMGVVIVFAVVVVVVNVLIDVAQAVLNPKVRLS